jgi:hypothetical protein
MSAHRDLGDNQSSGSEQGLGLGSCGQGTEPSSIITCKAFLKQMSNYEVLKKNSAPCSYKDREGIAYPNTVGICLRGVRGHEEWKRMSIKFVFHFFKVYISFFNIYYRTVFKNLFQLFILKGFSSSLEISLQIYLFS